MSFPWGILAIIRNTHRGGRKAVLALSRLLGITLIAAGCGPTIAPSASPTLMSTPSFQAPAPGASQASPTPEPTPIVTAPPFEPTPCPSFGLRCTALPMAFQLGLELTPLLDCGGGIICRVMVDVFYPTDPGPWPVIVIVPGGPLPLGVRANYSGFAQMLVGQGAVVFVADYRSSPEFGGGWPETFGDVACGIRFARASAAAYGGDGGHVTLVAHSFGGFPGSVVALSPTGFESDTTNCQKPAGSGSPDAYAGVAGVYTFDAIQETFLNGFFGGSRASRPDAWDAADILKLAQRPDARDIPVRLIAGTGDGAAPVERSSALADALASAGLDAQFTSILGAGHVSIMGNAETLATILEIARPPAP